VSEPRDPKSLYQALVLEHGKHPRREGPLAGATAEHRADNPLCGDRVTLRLVVADGSVRALRFEAKGCLIAKASASILGELVEGRTLAQARALSAELHALAQGHAPAQPTAELAPLAAVRDFPARVACVELPWFCLDGALGSAEGPGDG
jgi:nitrogen fixation NifU-like protein